jgi:pilus assembly protein CpaE
MAEPLSVVLVDRDPACRHAIRDLLKGNDAVRVEAEAEDAEAGHDLVNQLKPAIVIFGLSNPPAAEFAVIEQFLLTSPESALFVIADGERVETILRAMRAGATEFLIRPVNQKDLLAAVQRVARQRAVAAVAAPSRGKVITVFGSKGGRGTTVLALNLAAALATADVGPVVAVDLDLQAGDLSLFLNASPQYTIHDAVANMDRLDAVFLNNLLCPHPSGLSLLAAPQRVEEAHRIPPLRVTQLLTLLRASFAYVVVDTAPAFDVRVLAALDAADEVLLVVAPDVSSLYHMQRGFDLLERGGYQPAKVKILLNRCPAPPGKAVKMTEEVLKHPVFWDLPEDDAVPASLVAGEPLAHVGARSPFGARVMGLAAELGAASGSSVTPPRASKGFRNLFRVRALVSKNQRQET